MKKLRSEKVGKIESSVLEFIDSELYGLNKLMKLLGLSKRDLEIYFLILTSKGMTANEISEILDIPLPKVYESLSVLSNRRWIYKTMERPARYYSIPIREVWEDLKRKINDMMREVEEKIIPVLESMSEKPAPLFKVILLGKDRIVSFTKRIIRISKSEVAIAMSFPEVMSRDVIEELNKASAYKNIRLIVTEDVARILEGRLNKYMQVKKVDKLFGSGVIGDEILLIVRSGGELNGLWSDHVYFIDLGKVYFNYMWSSS